MSRAAEKIDALAESLRAGQPLSPAETKFAVRVLRMAAESPSRDMQRLLTQESRRERDQYLGELARRHCQDQSSIRAKVNQIIKLADQYKASAWKRGDKHKALCPERLIGTPEKQIWHVLKAGGKIPSRRHLHEIITNSML